MVWGGRHIFLGNFLSDGERWETYILGNFLSDGEGWEKHIFRKLFK